MRRWLTSTTDIVWISENILCSEVLLKFWNSLHVFSFVTRYSEENSVHDNLFQKIEEQTSRQIEIQLREKEIEVQKRELEIEELKRVHEKSKREDNLEIKKKEIDMEMWKKKKELELKKEESEIEHKRDQQDLEIRKKKLELRKEESGINHIEWIRNNNAEITKKKIEMIYDMSKECIKQTAHQTINIDAGYFSSTVDVREQIFNPFCKDVLNVFKTLMLENESKENLKFANEKQIKEGDKDELLFIK